MNIWLLNHFIPSRYDNYKSILYPITPNTRLIVWSFQGKEQKEVNPLTEIDRDITMCTHTVTHVVPPLWAAYQRRDWLILLQINEPEFSVLTTITLEPLLDVISLVRYNSTCVEHKKSLYIHVLSLIRHITTCENSRVPKMKLNSYK